MVNVNCLFFTGTQRGKSGEVILFRGEDSGTEKVINLPEVTQTESGRTEIHTWKGGLLAPTTLDFLTSVLVHQGAP